MIGVYKITSPKKRVYIGQSVHIKRRFSRYKKLQCENQVKLYRSFIKYGVDNHKFEIIVECNKSELDGLEIYYIDLYNATCFKNGLNCKGGGSNGAFTDETRKKMSESAKKRGSNRSDYSWSEESKIKASNSKKGKPSPRKGCILSDKQKEKLRNYRLGVKQSEETKLKRVLSSKGKINCKKLIDEKTGEIYNSVNDAAELFGYKCTTLSAMLSGQNKNKTNLKYL